MTRRRGRKSFSGGYRFARFEGQPDTACVDAGVLSTVSIPLAQGFGTSVPAIVATGDRVSAGQVVGRDDEALSSPVHASISGVVEEIRSDDPETGAPACVVIRGEGGGEWLPLEGHTPDWQTAPAEAIEDLLYAAGVTALGSGGIPTRHRSAAILPGDVESVIVHGTGSEMFNPSLPLLIGGDRLAPFIDGLRILRKVMSGASVHVAVDRRDTALVESLSAALTGDDGVEIHPLAARYPQGFDELLVPTVLGRPFPHGYAAANIGVVVLDCQAVIHAYEAVVQGKPVIERTLALCGPGFDKPSHARVLVGTALEDVVNGLVSEPDRVRFVKNSPLTGLRLSDPSVSVDRTFSSIIALAEHGQETLMPFVRPGFADDAYSRTFLACLLPTKRKAETSLKGEPRPCVSCGYCQDVCPVGIIPHLLYKYCSRGLLEDVLVELRIFNCIGCNLCSYVCPSKIAVGKHIREGQAKLRADGVDNSANILPSFNLKGLEGEEEAE